MDFLNSSPSTWRWVLFLEEEPAWAPDPETSRINAAHRDAVLALQTSSAPSKLLEPSQPETPPAPLPPGNPGETK